MVDDGVVKVVKLLAGEGEFLLQAFAITLKGFERIHTKFDEVQDIRLERIDLCDRHIVGSCKLKTEKWNKKR